MKERPNLLKKKQWAQTFREEILQYQSLFLVNPKGVNAHEDRIIRRRIKEIKGKYKLVKNRVFGFAIQGTPFEQLSDHLKDMTAIVYHEDGVELSKVIQSLVREIPELEFKAGVIEGYYFPKERLSSIANLPPRPVLLGQLLGTFRAPAQQFVSLISTPLRQFLSLLEQIKEKRPQTPEGGESMSELTKEQVIEYLSNLSVMEIVDLVKELEERWGVQAAAAMPVAVAGMAAAGQEVQEEEKEVKYRVVVKDAGQQKVQAIKVLRELFDVGLKEAKGMLEGLPKTIKEDITREEADDIATKLAQVGVTVEVETM